VNLVNSDNLGIVGNAIIDNGFGVILSNSNNATIFHNNFIDNTSPVNSSIDSRNSWDNGEEGNYWSTYEGSDSNHDGVGDEPRTIDASNRDNYPLMGRFFDFAVPSGSYLYHISIISNSSITVPRFNESITMLAFNVTSTISDGSFCRITIPHLLIPRPHTVLVEHEKANATTLPMSNATHSSLYFACRSNGMVRIFPKPYYDLLEEYTRLLAEHTQLQADFADLNATYTNLNQTYTQLNLLYANLQLDHTQLQADFDELNTTFHTLNQTYTQLSSSYASLQVDFHTLNSTYEKTKANYTQMYNRYRSLNLTYNQMQSEYADTRLTLSIVTIAAFAFVITPSLFGARYYVRSKNQAKLVETYRKRLDELSAGHLDAAHDLFEADVMRRGSKIEEFEEKYGITVRPHDTLEDIIGSLELKKKED
jgi:hypothetical protein